MPLLTVFQNTASSTGKLRIIEPAASGSRGPVGSCQRVNIEAKYSKRQRERERGKHVAITQRTWIKKRMKEKRIERSDGEVDGGGVVDEGGLVDKGEEDVG